MTTYVGIDLGTSNTVISTFDGTKTTVCKKFGQADSMPSAVHLLADGSVLVGRQAYDNIRQHADDVAVNFKQLIGSDAKIKFVSAGVEKDPIWCSSQVIREAFLNVPQALRNDPDVRVVVTVPAAFGQQQNEATRQAAQGAGLANVEVLSEPLAAALNILQQDRDDKTLLVYDMGAGTFDVSLVKTEDGKVSILAQGGIPHCGGTHWDTAIRHQFIEPWIKDNLVIDPDDLNNERVAKSINRCIEDAKIRMSGQIMSDEAFNGTEIVRAMGTDVMISKGKFIEFNIPVGRSAFDGVAEQFIEDSIVACKQLLGDVAIKSEAIDAIVFIGGPTLWPTLRANVTAELDIPEYTGHANPLTAVSEGAAIYAELSSHNNKQRASEKANASHPADANFPLSLSFPERVVNKKAVIQVTLDDLGYEEVEIQITGPGFNSGRVPLTFSKDIVVDLLNDGATQFDIKVFPKGIAVMSKTIEITRAIGIDKVPSNRSMFIRVLSKDGKTESPEYLVKKGQSLPAEGVMRVKSTKDLNEGEDVWLDFEVYEGEVADIISDNEFIGPLRLHSSHLKGKSLKKGQELICEYTLGLDLNLFLTVSIPALEIKIKDQLYILDTASFDPAEDWAALAFQATELRERILDFLKAHPESEDLKKALPKLSKAIDVLQESTIQAEVIKARGDVNEASKAFFIARSKNIPDDLRKELQRALEFFETGYDGKVKKAVTTADRQFIDDLAIKAEKAAAESKVDEFTNLLARLDQRKWNILWRCEWWIKHWLENFAGKNYSEDVQKAASAGLEKFDPEDLTAAKKALNDAIDFNNKAQKNARASHINVDIQRTGK